MPKEDVIELEGIVRSPSDANPGFLRSHVILAHISGKLRMHYIRILPEIRLLLKCQHMIYRAVVLHGEVKSSKPQRQEGQP